MNVSGIGVSSSAWDYWELMRRSEAKQNASVMPSALDAIAPVEKENGKTNQVPADETARVFPPKRQNLFAEQLAATILEQEESEKQAGGSASAKPFAAALGKAEENSSGSSDKKISIKSVTDGGTRYIVGVRVDDNGGEVEVFRIPQNASARKSPVKESDEFMEMELLSNSVKKNPDAEGESFEKKVKSALSSMLVQQARSAYGMGSLFVGA